VVDEVVDVVEALGALTLGFNLSCAGWQRVSGGGCGTIVGVTRLFGFVVVVHLSFVVVDVEEGVWERDGLRAVAHNQIWCALNLTVCVNIIVHGQLAKWLSAYSWHFGTDLKGLVFNSCCWQKIYG